MDRREDRVAGMVIWAVSLGSFATQMVFTSPARSWSWDEAIYLSQVASGVPSLPFVASRARGISLLVAPLSSVGAPGWLIRIFLAAASSLVLAVVFRVWVPRIGFAAPMGAFLFAASWPALLYGSEVMPNLWAALFAVGTVGYLVRSLGQDRTRSHSVGLVLFAAAMALMRPLDALILAIAVAGGVAVLHRRSWRALVPMAIGVGLGWLPWLVEMSVRYGDPVEAIRAAGEVSHLAGTGTGLIKHLALTDGPLLGPDAGTIPIQGLVWWGGLAALTVLALVRGRRWERAADVRLAAIAGAALALEYLVLVTGLAPRFLLPALAMLSIAAGCGLDEILRSGAAVRRTVTATSVVVVLTAWATWQIGTLRSIEDQVVAERAVPRAVGEAIRASLAQTVDQGPCLVVSQRDYPQVALAARCSGLQLSGPIQEAIARPGAEPGRTLVLVTREAVIQDASLQPLTSPAPGWFAYRYMRTEPS